MCRFVIRLAACISRDWVEPLTRFSVTEMVASPAHAASIGQRVRLHAFEAETRAIRQRRDGTSFEFEGLTDDGIRTRRIVEQPAPASNRARTAIRSLKSRFLRPRVFQDLHEVVKRLGGGDPPSDRRCRETESARHRRDRPRPEELSSARRVIKACSGIHANVERRIVDRRGDQLR